MQILTDILSLFKRKKLVKKAKGNDLLVLGVHEEPNITGIASPVPYKDVKLIKVRDLVKPPCDNANFPLDSEEVGVYLGEMQDPEDPEVCYFAFRRMKSLSLNLTCEENGDFIELNTNAEPNAAENVGAGAQLFKGKVGEALQFRTLTDNVSSVPQTSHIAVKQIGDTVDISINLNRGNCDEIITFDTLACLAKESDTYDLFREKLSVMLSNRECSCQSDSIGM